MESNNNNNNFSLPNQINYNIQNNQQNNNINGVEQEMGILKADVRSLLQRVHRRMETVWVDMKTERKGPF